MTVDLILTPTIPVSNLYTVTATTPAGQKFIHDHFFNRQYIQTGRDMRNFKEATAKLGLSYRCDWALALEDTA